MRSRENRNCLHAAAFAPRRARLRRLLPSRIGLAVAAALAGTGAVAPRAQADDAARGRGCSPRPAGCRRS